MDFLTNHIADALKRLIVSRTSAIVEIPSRFRAAHAFGILMLVTSCALSVGSAWGEDAATATDSPPPWVTPAEDVQLPPDFRAELVYVVPSESQGSWVSMTADPQGRLIASDQYGKLYRLTIPRDGSTPDADPLVEPIDVDLGHAQGLLCAWDNLYVMVNDGNQGGLFRVWDADGDDQYDQHELLLPLKGSGEHGPHAVILSPDQQWLYICAGNHTELPELDRSVVPTAWDEDHLLPQFVDPRGHAAGIKAPGGWICRVSRDGSTCELVTVGFRNEYDIAFNRDGALFTYDADMEWDLGSPWYRPTRINHALPGVDLGWRSGSAKWPEYYLDTLPAVVNCGPGSPTGICFGYGTRFPTRYRDALFAADWSMGRLLAVSLEPAGGSYVGEMEVFASAPALPITDLVVNPNDGALYFAVGGRKLQSAVYRIVYDGPRSSLDHDSSSDLPPEHDVRERLEALYTPGIDRESLDLVWSQMGHPDRTVRYAARVALEHQPIHTWKARLVADRFENPTQLHTAVVALARYGHRNDLPLSLDLLLSREPQSLSTAEQLDWLRALQLAFIRLGPPDERRDAVANALQGLTASDDPLVIRELATVMTYLRVEGTTEQIFTWMEEADEQRQRIHLLLVARMLANTFTSEQGRHYFEFCRQVRTGGGGKSYGGYIDNIAQDAFARLAEDIQPQVAPILAKLGEHEFADVAGDRSFVKQWTVEEALQEVTREPLSSATPQMREDGKRLFAEAQCVACHRFGGGGGAVGPNLSRIGGRMNVKDLLTTIIEPDREISDQYRNYVFELRDGTTVTGRIINLNQGTWYINPDMRNPGQLVEVDPADVETMGPSKTSTMPAGLLDTLNADELRALMAYLTAG